MILHPWYDVVQGINRFVVLFWWWWWYVRIIIYCPILPPFTCVVYRYSLLLVLSVEERFETCPCLELGELSAPFLNIFIKIAVCAKKVIPFDTTIASEIICLPHLANSHPFLSW